jgi:hypothetical protein
LFAHPTASQVSLRTWNKFIKGTQITVEECKYFSLAAEELECSEMAPCWLIKMEDLQHCVLVDLFWR